MKILFITSNGNPSGASIALNNIITGLIGRNIKIAIVFPSKGLFSEKMEQLGVKCYYIHRYHLTIYPRVEKLSSIIKYPITLIRVILYNMRAYNELIEISKNLKPDIIHTNVGPLDIGIKVAKKFNIKHVWHLREYQDLDFGMYYYPCKSSFYKLLNDSLNHSIAITEDIFQYWQLNKKKDAVIYDGVINDSQQLAINSRIKKPYFLFVGRFEKAKGIELLLHVFLKFSKINQEYNLLIAAKCEGKHFNDCFSFVQKEGLDKRIIFLGHRTDIYNLMSEATALIVPSRFEGFGFITVEAMYNYCLVIGKNTAGTKEQFDNGLRMHKKEIGYRFFTEEELLEIMLKVTEIAEVEYQSITRRAYETVLASYTIDKHVDNIEIFYKKILEG